ncbi:hypothetical protein NDU88_001083 [Pleurodeles waltl]|uniref:Uncharacterized protein n=1 Tax=Pleurodeles waltl TaxID=8319 RepID=A0AAV7NCF8_PLEWA|nr:hypothetical protein NDU88_001083 [Pleurodeles waltl]
MGQVWYTQLPMAQDEKGASAIDGLLPRSPWGTAEKPLPRSLYDFQVTGGSVGGDGEEGGERGSQSEEKESAMAEAPADGVEETGTSIKAMRRGGPARMKEHEGQREVKYPKEEEVDDRFTLLAMFQKGHG